MWKHFAEKTTQAQIAYCYYPALPNRSKEEEETKPRYRAIITGGRGETMNSFAQMAQERLDHGAEVWLLDWQGQGLSSRTLPWQPFKHHLNPDGYKMHVDTLEQFIDQVVTNNMPTIPIVLMSHSMGAHITLRYLAERDQHKDRSKQVACAVLTAPMLRIKTDPFPEKLTQWACRFAYNLGIGHWYAPTSFFSFFSFNKRVAPLPYEVKRPTFGWLHQSFESCRLISPFHSVHDKYWQRIKTPTLVQSCPGDPVVYHTAIEQAVKAMPHARLLLFPGSVHRLQDNALSNSSANSSVNAFANAFAKETDAFIDSHLTPK